jgi:polysaccharide export outer membrane protein
MLRRLLLLLALLAAGAAPARLPAQGAAADAAFLRPGDAIRLAVFRQPELSGEFAVGPEGTIQHPLLTEVVVVGVPRSTIRDRLRAALARYERDPAFVFDMLYRVSVGGEVRLPNLYTLNPQTTVLQAIAAAGGTTEFARQSTVHVLREGRDLVVDLTDPVQAAMPIRSGDHIRVGRRTNLLRDYIGPFAAVVAAAAGLIGVLNNN